MTCTPTATLPPSQTLLHSGTRLDLREAIAAAAELQPIPATEESQSSVFEFVTRRLEQLLVDGGVMVEVARAVLGERPQDPVLAQASAKELQVTEFAQG